MAGELMRRYSVALRCEGEDKESGVRKHTDFDTTRVFLAFNGRPPKETPHLEAVPFSADESNQGPKCWLQIWELDYYQTDRFKVRSKTDRIMDTIVDKNGKRIQVPRQKKDKKSNELVWADKNHTIPVYEMKWVTSPEPDFDAGPRENCIVAPTASNEGWKS